MYLLSVSVFAWLFPLALFTVYMINHKCCKQFMFCDVGLFFDFHSIYLYTDCVFGVDYCAIMLRVVDVQVLYFWSMFVRH
jgi:hypothetical protein